MNPLELTREEQQLLRQVLSRCLADLDHEIRHTDHAGFKQMLRQRRANLERIRNKIPEGAEMGATTG
jgi:hypothetical protein